MWSKISDYLAGKMLWLALIPLLYVIFLMMQSFIPDMPQDSPIEEAIEEMIENETGIQFDISPSSVEQP